MEQQTFPSVFLTSLSIKEVKFLLSEAIENYFSANPVQPVKDSAAPTWYTLQGLKEYLP